MPKINTKFKKISFINSEFLIITATVISNKELILKILFKIITLLTVKVKFIKRVSGITSKIDTIRGVHIYKKYIVYKALNK